MFKRGCKYDMKNIKIALMVSNSTSDNLIFIIVISIVFYCSIWSSFLYCNNSTFDVIRDCSYDEMSFDLLSRPFITQEPIYYVFKDAICP